MEREVVTIVSAFIDIIADERFDKWKQFLLDLAVSGRYQNHYLQLLAQSYSAIPKNLRGQGFKKEIFICLVRKTKCGL